MPPTNRSKAAIRRTWTEEWPFFTLLRERLKRAYGMEAIASWQTTDAIFRSHQDAGNLPKLLEQIGYRDWESIDGVPGPELLVPLPANEPAQPVEPESTPPASNEPQSLFSLADEDLTEEDATRIFATLLEAAQSNEQKPNMLGDAQWVFSNIAVPLSRIKPETVPSTGALGWLIWVKESPLNRTSFFEKTATKLLPSRTQIEREEGLEDDGRDFISTCARIQAATRDGADSGAGPAVQLGAQGPLGES